MSDDIRLLSVEIQNYRQYYGNHKLNFASREEGFTVIMGKNGEGKSNLLNAAPSTPLTSTTACKLYRYNCNLPYCVWNRIYLHKKYSLQNADVVLDVTTLSPK